MIAGMASLTDSEILEQYKLARDSVVAKINAGTHVTELTIRSKTSRFPSSEALLKHIESMITYYSRLVSQAAQQNKGGSRNLARMQRA